MTVPKTLHFLNRDTYRNRVENVMGTVAPTQRMILDMRSLVYIDASAIMTLQVGNGKRSVLKYYK